MPAGGAYAYDTGPASGTSGLIVVWHHGSPQTGRLPDPLLSVAADRGVRLLCHISVLDAMPVALDWVSPSGAKAAPGSGRRRRAG